MKKKPARKATHTHASKRTAPQLCTPLHCTRNMLVTTVVTHSGGAALHTCRQPQSAVSSADTPRTQQMHHSVAVAVGFYTTAVEHCDCKMHDRRACVTLVRYMDCQRPPQPPTTAPPLSHHEAMECMRTCNGTHRRARSNPTNGKRRVVDGESAAQHRKQDRSALSKRCVHITAFSHARATRTLCIVSMRTVCLQSTTEQPI
jgi:hypothetical protein